MTAPSDEITLTLPRHKPFYRIAHLVVGGLAVRLDLTWESLEDLQLALAGLLDQRPDDAGEVTVSVRVEGDTLRAAVGPFPPDRLQAELAREGDATELGLRRLLETVADRFEIREEAGGAWVELTKTVHAEGA